MLLPLANRLIGVPAVAVRRSKGVEVSYHRQSGDEGFIGFIGLLVKGGFRDHPICMRTI